MSTTIESLELEIKSSSTSAVNGIEALATSLGKLKSATSGGLGLNSVAKNLTSIKTAVDNMGNITSKLSGLSRAVTELTKLGNVKVSASVGNQITKIGTALSTLDIGDGANKINELVTALKPLETLGKSSLSTTVNALNKLPDAIQKIDMRKLHGQVDALTRTFRPLAEEMQKIANGFNAFPSRIQKLIRDNEKLSDSNTKTGKSYINLWAKMRSAYNTLRTGARIIGSCITKMNNYIENVNLFNVSMGDYAKEAGEYAEQVGEIMGIDPGEWMRNQGVFMTLATGFGVASDRAYTMSKNLTQLGYDLSSFFNISYEDAMLKLQSGLAGELEPLRRIGYDLSVARLQQEAYALGIDKKVAKMTQAEKAELRYHAILTQVTVAQGDMARTLNAPANQLRILKAQVEQAARAIGSIFIPLLNKVLPYLIALAKVVRLVASVIASLFGFEMPEVDYSGVKALGGGAEDASTALGEAADNAKKLQQYTMGFDELNVIDPNKGSSGSGDDAAVGGGGFGFELPEYDFLNGLTESKVGEIVEDMKEWLGLTGEITSWSDLFNTNLGKILIAVGAIGAAFVGWKLFSGIVGIATSIAGVFSKIGGLFGGGKSKSKSGAGDGGIDTVNQNVSTASTKLSTLVKNLALGLVIILEVVAAAVLIVGAIWLLGVMLEQVGIAWQPVIDNGGTIATAIGIGTVLLATIGVATAALGTLGAPVAGQIGLGIAILAEIGAAGVLFLAEIWVVGKQLDEIGKAWKPVLNDGGDIEKGIATGTGILIAIGVVTAALGMATVASAGALPLAIGLGTAILVELSAAFVLFCDSLVDVADKLRNDLHPALEKLNKILPDLQTEMTDFKDFMIDFALIVVSYTKSSAISGFAATVDSIIGFFTKDPIKALAIDVNKQYEQAKVLNEKLGLANPELDNAITGLGTYKQKIDDLKVVAESVDTTGLSIDGFTDLVTVGGKVASFGGKMKDYYNKIKDIKTTTMDNMVSCVNDVIDFAVRIKNEVDTTKIEDFTDALKDLTKAITDLPKSKTVTIKAIYQSSGSSVQGFASGGFPETGQMFIAREAGAEMVGTIGRKTAVANNDQIVAGIASGVAEANNESNSLLREQNSLLRAMLEKESGVYLDGKTITKSVEKHQRERGRVLVTGGAY